ncbi:MAG TPA: thiolase family protein [Acidimicrobiales bacterium]|nr:thiolase family protein [Acidimicrobiales bacterium]
MSTLQAHIPYGAYWSSPFVRWRGSLAGRHPLELGAEVARTALAERGIEPASLTELHLGSTVPSPRSFYGAPWVAGMIGAPEISGPTVSQACATSARLVTGAADEVEVGLSEGGGEVPVVLCLAADRISQGPVLNYPGPGRDAEVAETEDWVMDNFACDPWAGESMLQTAENVAAEYGVTTAEQHDVVLRRYEQYTDALADDAAFQRRYMVTPVNGTEGEVSGDEGVFPVTMEKMAALAPVLEGGTVTYAGQTHPADGNAGLIVTGPGQAAELATDPGVSVRIMGTAMGRAAKAMMPKANIPTVRRLLARTGWSIDDVDALKTHNPFAVNDIVLARELGFDLDRMNNYGSSLIFGHPQGPTGLRLIIELIEELAQRGGGRGVFTGCAAGDTAMAVAIEVTDAP